MGCNGGSAKVGGVRGQGSLMIGTIDYFHQFKGKMSFTMIEFSFPHTVLILFSHLYYITCLREEVGSRFHSMSEKQTYT